MQIHDLGVTAYNAAWKAQETAHEMVLAGGAEQLLLVEHTPVITYGRRPGVERNLIASGPKLKELGVEVVQSDRGGDITFHGPGQLVAYPIVRLADHRLSVSGYVHLLEKIITSTLAKFRVLTTVNPSEVGVWTTDASGCGTAKVCAIGVRIRRGVTMHGLALNVTTDLRYFDLIVPCGLANRPVTSLQQQLGDQAPAMAEVKSALIDEFRRQLFNQDRP